MQPLIAAETRRSHHFSLEPILRDDCFGLAEIGGVAPEQFKREGGDLLAYGRDASFSIGLAARRELSITGAWTWENQ